MCSVASRLYRPSLPPPPAQRICLPICRFLQWCFFSYLGLGIGLEFGLGLALNFSLRVQFRVTGSIFMLPYSLEGSIYPWLLRTLAIAAPNRYHKSDALPNHLTTNSIKSRNTKETWKYCRNCSRVSSPSTSKRSHNVNSVS